MIVTNKKPTTFSFLSNLMRNIFGRSSKPKLCETINEVLFYGTKDEEKAREIGLNNLFCIYYVIIHASRTIEVCVPSLASETILKCLIAAQKNNVKVRVAIHSSDDFHKLQSLSDNKIAMKVMHITERVEHEFILIDAGSEDSVAVLGSLDYATSRVNCNREATVLTSEAILVKALNVEFNRIWQNVEHNNIPTEK